MTTSSVSAALTNQQIWQVWNSNQSSNQDNAGVGQVTGSHHHHHHHGGNELMNAVQQSLNQMGLNLDALASGSSQSTSGTDTTNKTNTMVSGTSTAQALQTFMHDLFTAANDQSGTTTGNAGTIGAAGSYTSNMTSGLQDLIQALGAGGSTSTSSTQNGDLSTLQTDFQNLVAAMGGTTTGNQSANLQTFLQNLEQNLTTQSNPAGSIGTFINNIA